MDIIYSYLTVSYTERLNQLRKQWKLASKTDRLVIEHRAKLLKWALKKKQSLYDKAKEIFK